MLSRWREVVVHHGDLGLGPVPLPEDLVAAWLPRELPRLAERTDPEALLAWIIGRGGRALAGPLVAARPARVLGRYDTNALPERSTATQYAGVGHEMLVSAWPLSMRVPALQVVPFQPNTRPRESTARQKVGVGQDTDVRPDALVPFSAGSVPMDSGAVKPWPFQVSTSPLLSTMTQKVVDAHETEFSCPCVSTSLGWVHVLPFHTDGPPSAATQNVGDTQEIWLAAPQAPTLPDHPLPSKRKELPSPSMVMQKAGPVQSMAVMPCAAGSVGGRLPRGSVEEGDLVRVGRGGAEGRRPTGQVGGALRRR